MHFYYATLAAVRTKSLTTSITDDIIVVVDDDIQGDDWVCDYDYDYQNNNYDQGHDAVIRIMTWY